MEARFAKHTAKLNHIRNDYLEFWANTAFTDVISSQYLLQFVPGLISAENRWKHFLNTGKPTMNEAGVREWHIFLPETSEDNKNESSCGLVARDVLVDSCLPQPMTPEVTCAEEMER